MSFPFLLFFISSKKTNNPIKIEKGFKKIFLPKIRTVSKHMKR